MASIVGCWYSILATQTHDLTIQILGFYFPTAVIQILPQRGTACAFVVHGYIGRHRTVAQLTDTLLNGSHPRGAFIGNAGGL